VGYGEFWCSYGVFWWGSEFWCVLVSSDAFVVCSGGLLVGSGEFPAKINQNSPEPTKTHHNPPTTTRTHQNQP
jgi:hypothetical protein